MSGDHCYPAAPVGRRLEAEVTRTLRSIERGIAMLDDRRAVHAPAAGIDDGYDGVPPLEMPAMTIDEEEAPAAARR